MYSKRKMCCLIATCSLLVCMFRAEIFAKGNEQQELPEIIRWEEGRGFDEQGEQIVGSWAYDTVNVEGKYVLFDDMGNVSAKTDQWKERETYAENFTDTEQATATLALRTEYFPKFTGTVYITIHPLHIPFYRYIVHLLPRPLLLYKLRYLPQHFVHTDYPATIHIACSLRFLSVS